MLELDCACVRVHFFLCVCVCACVYSVHERKIRGGRWDRMCASLCADVHAVVAFTLWIFSHASTSSYPSKDTGFTGCVCVCACACVYVVVCVSRGGGAQAKSHCKVCLFEASFQ